MRARRSTALIAGAAAFAAGPALALADGGAAPRAVETASAITILLPGKPPVTLAPDAKGLSFRPHRHTATVHGATQITAAGPDTHGLQGAQSSAEVTAGRLFSGEIRFRGVSSSVQLTAETDGTVENAAQSAVSGLVVLGKPVEHPTPGQQIQLGDWGTLTVEATAPTDGGLTGGKGSNTVALDVTLSAAHAGLPAGSEIQIGAASAAITPVAPPASPPSGGSGGSGGPVHHHRHHHASNPPQRPSKPKHTRRIAGHHRVRPKRPIVTHPVTLRGSVRQRIVEAAESQIGWPYVWGGESEVEGGFDCSGLVDYAFAAAGRALPGRPTAEVLWMMAQPIGRGMLKPGDLVFLLDRHGYAFHVGLYAGHGRVVVAAHRGAPVAMQPLDGTPWVAYGRLWQRQSVAPQAAVSALSRQPSVAPIRREPQATTTATSALPAGAVERAHLAKAPAHHHSRRAPAGTTAARDEDMGAVADRPPRRRA